MGSTSNAKEVSAPDLVKLAIEGHGGLEHWKRFSTLSVHGINGGLLWGGKGKAGMLDDVTITVDLHNEKVSHWPFGSLRIEGLGSNPNRNVVSRIARG